jgi:hypothetical protein
VVHVAPGKMVAARDVIELVAKIAVAFPDEEVKQ